MLYVGGQKVMMIKKYPAGSTSADLSLRAFFACGPVNTLDGERRVEILERIP